MNIRLFVVLLCSCFIVACDFLLGEDEVSGQTVLEPGVIQLNSESPRIDLPAYAIAGVPFAVTVTTFGNGCVSEGVTRSVVVGLAANVEPFDSVYHGRPGEACDDVGLTFPHRATIVFQARGSALILVRGRQTPGNRIIEVRKYIDVY